MKNIKTPASIGIAALAALSSLTSTLALAQDTGWYGGISVGRSATTIDDSRITNGLLGQGLTTRAIADDDRDKGYKLFGGYAPPDPSHVPVGPRRMDPCTHTRQLRCHRRGPDALRPRQPQRTCRWVQGACRSDLPGRGLPLWRRQSATRCGSASTGHRGGSTRTPPSVVPPPVPRQAPAPAPPPAPMPAPPPALVVAPIARAPAKVSFSADSLFDFDKTTVKPAGQQVLDKFVSDLRGVSFETIQVTGHTDRLGPKAYNMTLSEHRAQAVSAWLVRTGSLPTQKIVTRGVGESAPLTGTQDCHGTKATRELIACLQPDRRVDVEVTGTRP